MVIDNQNHSTEVEDCIYHYRAKERGKFRVGSNKFWRLHDRRYNENYRDKASQYIDKKIILKDQNEFIE